jgi:hypothetical protein
MQFDEAAMADRGEATIRRTFAASAEVLFDAMFDADMIARFWGPPGMTAPADRTIIEPFVGGRFETVMVNDATGEEFAGSGIYTVIDRPRTLAFVEPGFDMVTTSTYTELGDGTTELVIVQSNVPAPFRSPEALTGFEASLGRLAALVEQG